SLINHQGYSLPYFRSNVSVPGDGNKRILLVNNVDDFRLPAVTSVDGRVEWSLRKRYNFAVDLDVFNLFNNATVLFQQYDLRLTGATGSFERPTLGEMSLVVGDRVLAVRFVRDPGSQLLDVSP